MEMEARVAISPFSSSSSTGSGKEIMSEKSICLFLKDRYGTMELFVYSISDKYDFKYDEQSMKKNPPPMKRGRDGVPIPYIYRRRHHHRGDPGMRESVVRLGSWRPEPTYPACIMLGSIIYLLGGEMDYERPSSPLSGGSADDFLVPFARVYLFDINSPNDGWKRRSSMTTARYSPRPLVVDGKIYVFGGSPELFGEVFDPSSQQWDPLPAITPDDVNLHVSGLYLISAVLDDPKRILLGSHELEFLHIYDVKQRSWQRLNCSVIGRHVNILPFNSRAAVFEQTLYFMNKYELVAYDLVQEKWLRGHVQGLKKQSDFGYFKEGTDTQPMLVHFRDFMFFLLWTSDEEMEGIVPCHTDSSSDDTDSSDDPDPVNSSFRLSYSDPRPEYNRFHFARIQISKEFNSKGKQILRAFVESCQSYVVDHFVYVMDAWVILLFYHSHGLT